MSAADLRRAEHLATVPASLRGVFERAFGGKSRATAIRAKCLDCCHFSRAEVAGCTVVICPLHSVRPYQQKPPKQRKTAASAGQNPDSSGVEGYSPTGAARGAKTRVFGRFSRAGGGE